MTADELLEALDASQREAVISPGAPLCILAGAGSGKTRVLTRRIAHRVLTETAEPSHVLALTFSRRAAGELTSRLGSLGLRERISAGTFHAVAYATLRQRWLDEGRTPPELLDRKVRIVGPLLGAQRSSGRGPEVTAADIAGEIEWAKARMIRPERFAAEAERHERKTPLPPGTVADLYRRYEEAKKQRRLVDFDDLLGFCANALERDPEFAAAQHWRFRHLFVDEFQDVNPLQFRLLEAWRGGRNDLCVVGDPDQAIYGWNGADADYLRNFSRHFKGATVVRLRENYRSSPEVLKAGHAVLATLPNPSPPLNPNRPPGAKPTITSYPDDAAEARAIARQIRDSREPGRSWSAFAVLGRTNALLTRIEESLRAAGVPYRLRSGSSLLDQPEVKVWLRERPADDSLETWLADLAELAHPNDDAEAMPPEREANLEALLRLGHEFALLTSRPTVSGFQSWLMATLQHDEAGNGRKRDAVELVTFHAAKGLEWPVVFLAGMERGLVPIGHAMTPAAKDEEVRLLYVAITRAEHELHISWAEKRDLGMRVADRSPSPFLGAIEATYSDRPIVRTDGAARVRSIRATTSTKPEDEPVLAALKAWRLSEARAASVPAFVIFSDATLAAVASARPRSQFELSRVPGIGPVKLSRYGERVLSIVAEAS